MYPAIRCRAGTLGPRRRPARGRPAARLIPRISLAPSAAASARVVRSQPVRERVVDPGRRDASPRIGHHVASVLLPPIRMTGDCPGARLRSSCDEHRIERGGSRRCRPRARCTRTRARGTRRASRPPAIGRDRAPVGRGRRAAPRARRGRGDRRARCRHGCAAACAAALPRARRAQRGQDRDLRPRHRTARSCHTAAARRPPRPRDRQAS